MLIVSMFSGLCCRTRSQRVSQYTHTQDCCVSPVFHSEGLTLSLQDLLFPPHALKGKKHGRCLIQIRHNYNILRESPNETLKRNKYQQ